MTWKREQNPEGYKTAQVVLSALLLAILLIVGLVIWLYHNKDNPVTQQQDVTATADVQEETVPVEKKVAEFDAIALQKTVDLWTRSQTGTTAVVISDVDGNILAAKDADQVFFAASVYKLYVAYEGYKQIDSAEVDPKGIYLEGYTRAECLDKMIRESYSPCAEKLWVELGKLELTNTLKTYGILNTSMSNITTTAADSAKILSMIATSEGLSADSQGKYLDSMKSQPELYRRGLPSGFSDKVIVYNKVGWNEQKEWHDTSIIELPDGRKFIVTVFTENVGSANISEFGTLIEQTLAI